VRQAGSRRSTPRGPKDPGRQPELRSWRQRLSKAWPLGVSGAGGAALAAVLALQPQFQAIGRLSPDLVWVALSTTAIVVGLAAFLVGREEPTKSRHKPSGRGKAVVPLFPQRARPTQSQPGHWYGRPVPAVRRGPPAVSNRSMPAPPTSWSPEEAEEVPSPLRLLPETEESPFPWNKGRLLRLSKEGALTVYSLNDALQDLEIVSQTVHGRRIRRGATSGDAHDLPFP
jgi:hypothetical protein